MSSWIRSHETLSFFVLTFALSWLFWIPSAIIFSGSDDPQALIVSPLFVGLQTLGAVGPSVAALALTRAVRGKEALRTLLARFKPQRLPAVWYVASVGLAPALTVAAMAVDAAVSGSAFVHPESGLAEMAAEMGWLGAIAVLPVVLLSQLFSSPLLEEAGWRGYALPRMQARASALVSALVLGVIWGLWHLPLVIAYGDPFGPYLAGIVAYTVLITWVYNNSAGSIFLMLLFHASLNLSLNILLPMGSTWTPALLAWGAVLVIVVRFGPRDLSARGRFVL